MSASMLSDDVPVALFPMGTAQILNGGNLGNPLGTVLTNGHDFNLPNWSERDFAEVLNIIEQQAPALERVSSTPLPFQSNRPQHRQLTLHLPQGAGDILAMQDDQLLRDDDIMQQHQQLYDTAQQQSYLLTSNNQQPSFSSLQNQQTNGMLPSNPSSAALPQAAFSESTGQPVGQAGQTSSSGPDSPTATRSGKTPKPKNRRTQASHRVIEKQRRDRINTLMEELRDLVAPRGEISGSAAEDKRPMHTVLSDAITQLKALQQQVTQSNGEVHRLQVQLTRVQTMQMLKVEDPSVQSHIPQHAFPNSNLASPAQPQPSRTWESMPGDQALDMAEGRPLGLVRHPSCVDTSVVESQSVRAPSALHPDGAWMPTAQAVAANVVVEQGVDCLYVKLSCRLKASLLNDISATLRTMPVEIRAASISTMPDGTVCDELRVVPAAEGVTMQDLQCRLATALYTYMEASKATNVTTPKKRRTSR